MSKNSNAASVRPRRSPLATKNRLSVRNKEDGYVYRIANTYDPNRVTDLEEQGYEIVPKEAVGIIGDKRVDSASALGSAATVSLGKGDIGVLMRQKLEHYKEDQSIKQADVDASEQTMKRDAKRTSDYGTFHSDRD